MKRLILSLSLILVLGLVMAGCGSSDQDDTVIEDGGLEQEGATGALVEPTTEVAEEAVGVPEETEEGEAAVDETVTEGETESAQASGSANETEVLPPTGEVNLNRMSNLVDFEVWNNNNEQIGDVNAIVINKDSSQIEYVIVGSGGFLGLGEAEIPVPWQVIQLRSAPGEESQDAETPQNVFILNVLEEDFEQMPEFDLTPLYEPEEAGDVESDSETMSLEQLEQEIHAFWQSDINQGSPTDTAGEEAAEADQSGGPKQLVLADDLLNATLQSGAAGLTEQANTDEGVQEKSLGFVEEIMIDANMGKVTYLLVSLDSAAVPPAGAVEDPAADTAQQPTTGDIQEATDDQIMPIPLAAVEWNAEEEALIYTGDKSLEQAPFVSRDEIGSGSSNWVSEADSFWSLEDEDLESQDVESEGTESEGTESE